MSKLYALSKLASKESRPALQGVLIRDNRATATNGYILARTSFDHNNKDVNIPARSIRANTSDTIDLSDDKVRLLNGSDVIECEAIEENFPSNEMIEKLFKQANDVENPYKITLGLDTLEPLVNMMKASKSRYVQLVISHDKNAVIGGKIKSVYGDEYELLLMPVKDPNNE